MVTQTQQTIDTKIGDVRFVKNRYTNFEIV